MINGEIPMSSTIQTVDFADDQRRDTDVFYYTDGWLRRWSGNGEIPMSSIIHADGWLRRWSTARYRCLLLYRRLTSPMINGEIPMSSTIQTVDFADDQRRDTNVLYYTDGWLRRWSTARYRCLLLYRRLTSPMINGEITMSSTIQTVDFADDQRRDTNVLYYTDGWLRRWSTARYRCLLLYRRLTSPMINGEITMSSTIQTVDFADDQRRDTNVLYYTDGWLRRWSTARYRCLLLYRQLASPMINGEIPMSSIIQTVDFADDQRRDIDVFYYTDGSLLRWSTARYRCLLLYRRLTSPMINGEIPMSSIIQTVRFAADLRRDIDAFYYTDGWLRRWSTARYRCLLLYRRLASPMINGEISMSSIIQTVYFAVVQRRHFSHFYKQGHSLRCCTTAKFRFVIYNFFYCNLHIAKLAKFYSFCILKQSHNMWKYVHPYSVRIFWYIFRKFSVSLILLLKQRILQIKSFYLH